MLKHNFISLFVALCERAISRSTSANIDDDGDDDADAAAVGGDPQLDRLHRHSASEKKRYAQLHTFAEYVWRRRFSGTTTEQEAEEAEAAE